MVAVAMTAAVALAAPAVAAASSPGQGGHGSTTTTTTPPSSGGPSGSFATLLIKPDFIGHVAVAKAGTTTFTPGTNDEQLHVGDTVQTDAAGRAEIDYATNAYTRLNYNTTFTIKKLTDNRGNRQIDGGLTTGETWNRTEQLTQSESFQQDGGGVSAAVSGTAFVADCTTATQCTFTAVIDTTHLTGPNGQAQTLNPLTQCVTQNAALCAAPSMLTPDQLALIQWIQYNVYLDLADHGLGTGVFDPFSVSVTVTNGVVTSVSATTTQGVTPPTPTPTPAPPPAIDPTHPIVLVGSPFPISVGACGAGARCPANSIDVTDDQGQTFTLNLAGAAFVQFDVTALLTSGLGQIIDQTRGATVTPTDILSALDQFAFQAADPTCPATSPLCDTGTTSFSYTAIGPGGRARSSSITVNVSCDSDDACPPSVARVAGTAGAPTAAPASTTQGSTTVPAVTAPGAPAPSTGAPGAATPGVTAPPTASATGSSTSSPPAS